MFQEIDGFRRYVVTAGRSTVCCHDMPLNDTARSSSVPTAAGWKERSRSFHPAQGSDVPPTRTERGVQTEQHYRGHGGGEPDRRGRGPADERREGEPAQQAR